MSFISFCLFISIVYSQYCPTTNKKQSIKFFIYYHFIITIYKSWRMLTKKKKINVLTVFFISRKSCVKIFLKWIVKH